jgi:hypothetical protein
MYSPSLCQTHTHSCTETLLLRTQLAASFLLLVVMVHFVLLCFVLFCFVLFCETRYHYVAQTGLELTIFLPLAPKC